MTSSIMCSPRETYLNCVDNIGALLEILLKEESTPLYELPHVMLVNHNFALILATHL